MGMSDKDQKSDDNFNADLGRAACQALIDAYRKGHGGSIDWNDIDNAAGIALQALGLPETALEPVEEDETPGMGI